MQTSRILMFVIGIMFLKSSLQFMCGYFPQSRNSKWLQMTGLS